MIKTLEINKHGRDFVVGDLHGQLHLLEAFMAHVVFNPEDRIISVGDLIDRGQESLECLDLIGRPWFHSVKGNHEQLMEDYLTGGPTGKYWSRNGGTWWDTVVQDMTVDTVENIARTLQNLPWLITVTMQNGKKFHVLHAELPNIPTTDVDLASETEFAKRALTFMGDGEAAIWGRDLWGGLYGALVDEHLASKINRGLNMKPHYFNSELSHIYSGHTIMQRPTTIRGQTNLDTGAFLVGKKTWAALTATEPLTGEFWKSSNEGVFEVQPVVI